MTVRALRRNGIKVVEDSTIYLSVSGGRLALSVVTYTYPERPTEGQLEKSTNDLGEAYKIFLVHQPICRRAYPRRRHRIWDPGTFSRRAGEIRIKIHERRV